MLLETLEGRRLLAVTTQPLGGDQHVVFEGDSSRDTVQFSVVDGFLQHNLGSRPGFDSGRDLDSVTPGEQALLIGEIASLTVNDSGVNDLVSFSGSEALAFAAASVTLSVGDITISPGVSLSTTDGTIDLTAAETIWVRPGASIATVDGGISLTANQDASTSSANTDYFGVHLDGAVITTAGAGAIILEGTGIHSGSNFSAGVGIEGGTTIESTSQATDAGEIRITGIGADGRQSKHGVISREDGNSITSAYGNVRIEGIGGFRSDGGGANYWGIYLAGLDIASTGLGPEAATITVDGVGGNETSTNYGVRLSGENVSLSTVDGDINIIGRGGEAPNTSRQSGIVIENVAHIRSTGIGPDAANISFDGTVGTATEPQTSALAAYGVQITGISTDVSTIDGDITITGSGGLGGVQRHGVSIDTNISSTGTGLGAGNIIVTGQGGTTTDGWGAFIAGNWSTVDGDITITGMGTNSLQRGGNGIQLRDIDLFASTGVGTNAGNISIVGSASSGTGVILLDSIGSLTTVDGDITLSDSDDSGVVLDGFGGLASTGVGTHAGKITVAEKKVSIRNLRSGIFSVDGDILIASEADDVSGSGLVLNNFGSIESTGVGPDAATITLIGTASDGSTGRHGASISGASNGSSAIRSVDGDISITAAGGDRTDPTNRFSENRGVSISNVTIESTGTTADAAVINLHGAGGESGRNGYGVYLEDSRLKSVAGNVMVDGTASAGRGVYFDGTDTDLTGSGDFAGDLMVTGSSIQVSGDVSTLDGDFSAVAPGSNFSGSFQSTGAGSFNVEATGIAGQANVNGDVQSAYADITVRGSLVSVGGIHSTGTGVNVANILLEGHRVFVTNGDLSTVDGGITITSQEDTGESTSAGIFIRRAIRSTGTSADVDDISISSIGSANSQGVNLQGGAILETVDANIEIAGQGSNAGVSLSGFTSISSTGVGANAGAINIVGTGSDASSSAPIGITADGNDTGVISTIDGDIRIIGSGGTTTGTGSTRGIDLRELSVLSTSVTDGFGNVTLDGTAGSGNGSGYQGVYTQEVNVSTVAGNVLIQGQGGQSGGSSNDGVLTVNTSISSTGSSVGAGTISIHGTGGAGASPDGVGFSSGTIVESNSGDISIVGQGGSSRSKGIEFRGSNIRIESKGTGDHAADITINGTGGTGSLLNTGIEFFASDGVIETRDGDLQIVGTGGNGNSNGVLLGNWGEIASKGFGDNAGEISLIGEGNNSQAAIVLSSSNANFSYDISSFDGNISLVGDRIESTGDAGPVSIRSLGSGPDAADILIDGQNSYVALGPMLSVTTFDGSIDLTGTGVFVSGLIQSTGSSPDDTGNISINSPHRGLRIADVTTHAADITIEGNSPSSPSENGVGINGRIESLGVGTITITGSSAAENRDGIEFGTGGEIVSRLGDISLLGTGGQNGTGIEGPIVHSLGSDGDTAAKISLVGNGSDLGGSGVLFVGGSEQSPTLSTVAGDVTIRGVGGDGTGNRYRGVYLSGGYVTSTGVNKQDAGSITIEGSGGDGGSELIGVEIRSTEILSESGDISITGTAGTGTSSSYGVRSWFDSVVGSTGADEDAADITITGNSDSNHGVYLSSGRLESVGPGDIDVVATGAGDGTIDDLFVTGSSVLGGTISDANIRLTVDSFDIESPALVQSSGIVVVQTRTPGTSVGLGSGTGELSLDNDELALFDSGLGRLSIGTQASPVGAVDLDNVVIAAPLAIYSDSTTDQSGVDVDSASSVTFGTVASPGAPLGQLQVTGDLVLEDGNILYLGINGPDPSDGSVGYDQIQVQGQVILEPGTRLFTATDNGFPAAEDQSFVVIENDSTDPVIGTFDGMPEGTIVEDFLGTALNARISYLGVDGETGNDVVLTTTNVRNPIYDFPSATYESVEGDATSVTNVVTIQRSEETSIPTSVDVIVSSGSATAGVDFNPEPITVDFAAGETIKTVPIEIFGERQVEDNETIQLSFGNFTDYGFPGTTQPTATLTLINDEFAPIASFSGNFTPDEGITVTFDASGSSDFEDGNEQLVFEWDFDYHGAFATDATGEQVEFSRPDGPASQTVALRVTDTEGNATEAVTQVDTVNSVPVVPPQLPQTIKAYNYAELNMPVPFIDTGRVDSHVVEIDYDDGSPLERISLNDGERGFSLRHNYQVSPGTTISRNVRITITDSDGAASTSFVAVNIEDQALTIPDNRPTLSIRTTDVFLAERETFRIQQVNINLDRAFSVETFIPLDLSASTATLDSDYRLTTELVRFAPFQLNATVFLNTIDDTAYEPDNEIVVVGFPDTLEVARVSNLITDQQFVATIYDDGDRRPTVSFSSTGDTFREGDEFELVAVLSDVAQEDVIVPLAISDDADVSFSNNQILIPAGQLEGRVTATVVDDDLSEPQETFSVSMLPNAQNFPRNFSYSSFVGAIRASDAVLVSMAPTTILTSEDSNSVQITITASEPLQSDLVLPITYTSSNAVAGADFDGPSTVTLSRQGPPRTTLTINLINDRIGEDDETLFVKFGDSLPDGFQLLHPGVGTRVQIEDDDVAELNFIQSASTSAAVDGESFQSNQTTIWEDSDAFELTISTGGVSFDEDVEIPIRFSAANRGMIYNRSGADLIGPSSTVTLEPGQTTVTFTVTPSDDSFFELSERGHFALSTGDLPGARLGRTSSHEIIIKDNDPRATVSTDKSTVGEDAGTITFEVSLSGTSNRRSRIPFKTYGGAENGVDYEIVSETRTNYKVRSNYVEIEPGQRTAIIKVKLKNDAVIEGREIVGIYLRPKYGSTTISNASLDGDQYASVLIDVDERPRPSISQVRGKQPGSSSYSSTSTWIREGGSLRIRVSMPNAANRDVWVPVTFPYASGRAASLGPTRDFTTNGLSNGWLRIPAYKKSAEFFIHTIDDLRKEDSEKIRATIGQPVVWDFAREDWVNFGSVGDDYYKFVGIRSSDQDTVYCPSGVQYGSLAIADGCVVDAFTTSSGPTLANDWTAGSSGSLQIANGYLGASEVFLDGNFNGRRDFVDLNGNGLREEIEPMEPLVSTFTDGSFLLDFPAELDRNENDRIDADEAQLVAFGGTDPATGITEQTRLTAPSGSFVVTPLTTLAGKLVNNHAFTVEAAHAQVLVSLRLGTFEYWRNSAISATVAGDLVAAQTYPSTVAVNNTAIVVGSYLSELSAATPETSSELVYDQMAEFIQTSGSRLRLEDPLVIASLVENSAAAMGAKTNSDDVEALSQVLATNSESLYELPVSADLGFLEAVSKYKIVARGEMTSDAALLAANSITTSELLTKYSVDKQANLADEATVGVIEPVRIVVSDASILEGDDGSRFAEFQVAISDFFTEPVSVDYITEDDAATTVDGDYAFIEGTLSWDSGDAAVQTIRVPVFGDTDAEFDETFKLVLQSATGALIQRSIGQGLILADDGMTFSLPPTTDMEDVLLTIEGDQVSIRQDGESILDGSLNKAADFVINTAASESGINLRIDARKIDVSNRGVTLVSNATEDRLELANGLDLDVTHRILSSNSGSFNTEDQAIKYQGFSDVANERAPIIRLESKPAFGETLTVVTTTPDQLDREGSTSRWSLVYADTEIAFQETDEPFSFIPDAAGLYHLSYTIVLEDDTVVSAVQEFDIQPLNESPAANAGGPYTVGEGLTLSLDATASTDPDLPGDVLTYQWDLDGDGIFGELGPDASYGDEVGPTPTLDGASLDGPSSIDILLRVIDSFGETDTDTASVNIENVSPTLTIDTVDVVIDEGKSASKLISAADVPTDTVSVEASLGAITANDDGTWTWTYDGTDDLAATEVTITARDEDGGASEATFTLTVENVIPNAAPDAFEFDEDEGARTIDLSANDTDAAGDQDPLTITSIDGSGLRGTATLLDGVVRYDPAGRFETLAPGQTFAETFTYTISDDDGGDATGTVTITIVGANDAPTATLDGSAGDELDGLDQQFTWDAADVDGNLTSVEIEVTKDGDRIDSLSGPVAESGSLDLNDQGVGLFEVVLTATDSAESIVTANRLVSVSDDDSVAPQITLSGSSGTELEIDTNEYSWSVEDASGLSALSVTVTRDAGEGPVAIYTTTDIADATGSFNFDDYGVGIYEVLVVATDADGDWAGDAASSSAGRTSVVGELFVSTSTRAKLEVEDGQWVKLHRADVTSTHDGDVLFDHSQLSHPWFSWWTPNLNAFHMLADGSMILSTEGRGNIGDQDFRDGGLVRFFGDEWLSRNPDNLGQLHQSAQMIATEQQLFGNRSLLTGVDAISIAPDGNLIISLDRNGSLADGQSYHRGDLIKIALRQDGTLASSELYFDHQVLDATGWRLFGRWFDQGVDVDGAHVLEDGRIVLSVSSTATAGDSGDNFRNGDVFVYDPNTDLAELLFDEDSFRRNEEVDAVFLGIGNGELSLLDSIT